MRAAARLTARLSDVRSLGPAGSVRETTLVNALLLGVGLVLSIATARALGPAGRGVFTLATTIGGLALLVAGIGLQQALAYHVARDATRVAQANHLLARAAFLVGTPVAAGGGLAAVFLSDGDLAACLVLVAATLPIGLAAQHLIGVLQGLQRLRRFNIARAVPTVATTVAVAVLALAGELTPVLGVGAYAAGLLLGLAVAASPVRGAGFENPPRDWSRSVLRYGLIVSLASIAYQANRQLAVVVVGAVGTLSEVGQYGVALGYATPVAVVASAVAMHVLPEIAAARNGPAWQTIAHRRLLTALAATVPVALLMIVLAPVLVPLCFGPDFRDSIGPAQLLCLALGLLGIGHVLHEICRGVGALGWAATIEGAGAVVSILLVTWAMPRHGITGAAAGVATTYAVTCSALVFLVSRLRSRA